MLSSTEEAIAPFPSRPRHPLQPLLLENPRQIDLARAGSDIDRSSALDRSPLPDLEDDVKQENNRRSQVSLEERQNLLAGGHLAVSNRPSADPELRDQHEAVEDEANVRADDSGLRLERQLVQTAALLLPRGAEANVTQAGREPGEDQTETADGKHPGESFGLGILARCYDEAKEAEGG